MQIDFVLDLDHVLVDYLGTPETAINDGSTAIRADGVAFAPAIGASAFLEALRRVPGGRISFYTRSKPDKTRAVLSALRLPCGETALSIAHTVLSYLDVVDAETGIPLRDEFAASDRRKATASLQPAQAFFRGPRKKDLRRIPNVDLGRCLLLDDEQRNVAKGQERNILWLEYKLKLDRSIFLARFQAETDLGKKRKLLHCFQADRERLFFAMGVVHHALQTARTDSAPLASVLWRLQWVEVDGKPVYRTSLRFDRTLTATGLRCLLAFDSSLQQYAPVGL